MKAGKSEPHKVSAPAWQVSPYDAYRAQHTASGLLDEIEDRLEHDAECQPEVLQLIRRVRELLGR